jgi:hypothetical protein
MIKTAILAVKWPKYRILCAGHRCACKGPHVWHACFIQSSMYAWLSNWNVSEKFLPSLQQNCTHTCSSSSLIVTNPTNSLCTCSVQRCRSTTNADSETGQTAICCQHLMLGTLSSCSTLSVMVGALSKNFGLFLNMPCISPGEDLRTCHWVLHRCREPHLWH